MRWVRGCLRFSGTQIRRSIVGIIGIGILLHLTVRDQFSRLDGIFYALPMPVLAGLAGLLVIWPGSSGRQRKGAFITTCVLTIAWLARSWCWNEPEPLQLGHSQALTVFYWNLSRPVAPSQDLIETIRQHQPDIVGCGEPGPRFWAHEAPYEAALPGYDCIVSPNGLLLLTRHPAKLNEWGDLNKRGTFATFSVSAPSGPLRVVIADVHSDPFKTRRPSLEKVIQLAGKEPRSVIMGDFNTPIESVWFRPFFENYAHAFSTAGRGLRETWFFRLPILSIDHVWVGKGWRVQDTAKIERLSSDHAGLIVRMESQ